MKTTAILAKIETMSDGGYRIRLETNEITPEDALQLFYLKGGYVQVTIEADASR